MHQNQPFRASIDVMSGRPPWVGRKAELGDLQGLLGAVRRGGGGCALVEGPPGIGKSSLVREAVRTAGGDDVLLLRGSADEFCVSLPFQLVTEALRPVRGAESAPEPGSLWGAGARDPLAAGVQQALAQVERACAVRPVVLVASDLQWADEASLAVFGSLMRLTVQLPLLLVGELTTGSTREEVRQLRRAVRAHGVRAIMLGPLNADEAAVLAEKLLTVPLSPSLRDLVLTSGGNPLYVRELTGAMVREKRLEVRGGQAHLVTGPESGRRLPKSLGAAIADRVGCLSKDALEVLRTASMLGTTFDSGELAAVVGWPVDRVVEALNEASETGVLTDTGAAAEFQAPLLRQALYESMPITVRGLKHRQAAQVLSAGGWPAERVAAHLSLAGGTPDTWTVNWLGSWGTALLSRVPELVRDLLQRATDSMARDDERREPLEAVLAMAAFLRGRQPECEELAARVLARTEDPDRAGEMTWLLAYTLLSQARGAEGIEAVVSAPARWELSPVWRARLCALHALLLVMGSAPQDESAFPVLNRALELGRAQGDAQSIAYASQAKFLYCVQRDRYEESRACLEEGIAVAADAPQLTDVYLIMLTNNMVAWEEIDLIDRAWESARAVRKRAIEAGTARLQAVLVSAARLAYMVGAWDEALADLETAREMPMMHRLTVLVRSIEVLIRMHRGEMDAARDFAEEVGDPDRLNPTVRITGEDIWRIRLAVAEAAGRQEEVRAILRRICDDDVLTGINDAYVLLAPAVRSAQYLGDRELAADVLAAARREAERDVRPKVRAAALWCQGMVEAAPQPLREALAYYREVGRVEAFGCAEDLSVVLAQAGDTEAAKAAMRVAVEGYLALGATGDLDRADARWRELGLRRGAQGSRKRAATGWGALTPTEQRIAELVAEGLSNPDIGERLYSSRRTIQTHVTHILAKLGLRSRGEVARAIAYRPGSWGALPIRYV
ncbi:ATP-binding protein [Streptomyces sp. NPDC020681]|uniref:ATP-binding protein n=1 Tax=Streptomyces sp. NPDC020681 TaxID=3365083 RepID=UPI0037A2BBC1